MMTHTVRVALAVALLFLASCADKAGQLRADRLDPLVQIVTSDLEAYLDEGIAPDGEPLTEEQVRIRLGGIVALRNALHVAMGREREQLPMPEVPR